MSKDSGFCARAKRERKKWQVEADASAVFAKSHGILTRDALVIRTNKKRTDECINQAEAGHRRWAAVCGVPPRERLHLREGGIIAAPRRSSCIWNLPELIICAPLWEAVAGHQAQEIYSPADRRLSGINAVHCQIINQMHAGLITCRQGETFGTLIIKLKLNLNCKFFFSYFQCQRAFAVVGALCGLKKICIPLH